MKELELFNFLQLADSAWPVGSFAFSYGLEALSKHGQLKCVGDLSDHLKASLEQSLVFDVPILHSLYREDEFEASLRHYHLLSRVPSIRKAAESQGRAWLRLIPVTHPQVALEAIEKLFSEGANPPYFIAVFAKFMQAMGYEVERAVQLFLYGNLRDQLSAAIRLGLVGPSQGHAILSKLLMNLKSDLDVFQKRHYLDAVRILPVCDVAQLAHAKLYSKLFRN